MNTLLVGQAMAPWNPAYMTEVLAALGKRGESLFVPGDTGYVSAKAIYNIVPKNYPDFVYECHSVSDVVRAVRTAVNFSLPIAIKSGGYSMEGFSTCTGPCIQGVIQEDIILCPIKKFQKQVRNFLLYLWQQCYSGLIWSLEKF